MLSADVKSSVKPSLVSRAKAIHGELDPKAQKLRTTAVTEAVSGNGKVFRIVGSSENSLNPAQRAALQPGEIPAVGNGHAEVTTLSTAKNLGLKPVETAATREICPDCAHSMYVTGSTAASPVQQH